MKFKLSASIIFMFGCIIAIGYLWIINQLTPPLFFIFGILAVVSLFYSTTSKRLRDRDEIANITYKKALELQDDKKSNFPSGTIRITEVELKYFEVQTKNPEVIPDKWHVEVIVDDPGRAFLFKVSIYGNVVSHSEIKQPTKWSVTDTPERTAVSGTLKRLEGYEEHRPIEPDKEVEK